MEEEIQSRKNCKEKNQQQEVFLQIGKGKIKIIKKIRIPKKCQKIQKKNRKIEKKSENNLVRIYKEMMKIQEDLSLVFFEF